MNKILMILSLIGLLILYGCVKEESECEWITIMSVNKILIGTGDNSQHIEELCSMDNFILEETYNNGTIKFVTRKKEECYEYFDEKLNGWKKRYLNMTYIIIHNGTRAPLLHPLMESNVIMESPLDGNIRANKDRKNFSKKYSQNDKDYIVLLE